MFLIIAILFAILPLYSMESSEAELLFQEGNRFYDEERILEAKQIYLKLFNSGYQEEVAYNIGTSAFKLHRLEQSPELLAEAIYYLRLAQNSHPFDDDIRHNLILANEGIEQDIFSGWVIWLGSEKPWRFLAHFILCLFSIMIGWFVYKDSIREKKSLYIVAAIALSLIVFSIITWQTQKPIESDLAVIRSPHSKVLSEPLKNSEFLISLQAGSIIKVLEKEEEWLKIKMGENRVGWVSRENCLYYHK